jgi:endonuclease YncB( thermonuclease family)
MKNILVLILASLTISAHPAPEKSGVAYNYPITRVIDGDTVAFQAPFLPPPLKPELSIRVYGVDTPEKGHRAKCAAENNRGLEATAFTKRMIANAKRTQVVIIEWDKYGGRALGDILIDGISLRSMLISSGYAKPYFGDAKSSWCAK